MAILDTYLGKSIEAASTAQVEGPIANAIAEKERASAKRELAQGFVVFVQGLKELGFTMETGSTVKEAMQLYEQFATGKSS